MSGEFRNTVSDIYHCIRHIDYVSVVSFIPSSSCRYNIRFYITSVLEILVERVGRPRYRWKDNTKMDFRKMGWHGLDASD
jgi:hypothetical protein